MKQGDKILYRVKTMTLAYSPICFNEANVIEVVGDFARIEPKQTPNDINRFVWYKISELEYEVIGSV